MRSTRRRRGHRAGGASRAGLVVLGWGLACGGGAGGAGTSLRTAVDTVGDTIVVRTVAGSVWGDTATLTPELSLGVFEGAEEQMFGSVRAIAVGAAGDLYILDGQASVVRHFAADGTYLGSIGREGAGPGELRRPEAMALRTDGRLLVRDPGNARINVYDSTGAAESSWRLPGGGRFSTIGALYVDTARNAYTVVLLTANAPVTEWRYGLAKFTPDGTHRDTLPVPTWDFDPPVVTASREGSSSSNIVPFSPSVNWTFSPLGYFVGGVSTAYRFDLFLLDGRHRRIERADWTPAQVLGDEKAERERSITENFTRNYGTWRWNGPSIPATKPPYRNLQVAEDNRIWVQVAQPGYAYRTAAEAQAEEQRTNRPQGRFREHTAFDVFEPDGRYLGQVKAPDDFRTFPAPVMRGDYVWAVTRDDLDVQRVVRYRITRAERP